MLPVHCMSRVGKVGCPHVHLYIRFQLSAWLTQATRTHDFYSPASLFNLWRTLQLLFYVDTLRVSAIFPPGSESPPECSKLHVSPPGIGGLRLGAGVWRPPARPRPRSGRRLRHSTEDAHQAASQLGGTKGRGKISQDRKVRLLHNNLYVEEF